MLDQFAKTFKDHYELQWDDYIISYTFDQKKWYWLKVPNTFESVAEMLLKCNDDVKEIKLKINRLLWLSETIVGKWLWVTRKKQDLLEMMFIVELQMYMVTKATFKFNKKLHERLKTDILTSKLFPDEKESNDW